MNKSKVIIHNKQFEPLRPILNLWFRVLQTYINRTGDLPSWYRERPQVGFLATAAWNFGWATLEEWGTKKGPQRKQSRGRNDLWIGLPKKGQEWFIEAKHTWCDVGKGGACISQTLTTAMKSANDSAKRLSCKSPSNKVAAVFVSPIWRPGVRNTNFKKTKAEWFNLCKARKVDAIAVFFAKGNEIPKEDVCMGSVVLLLKLVK